MINTIIEPILHIYIVYIYFPWIFFERYSILEEIAQLDTKMMLPLRMEWEKSRKKRLTIL